MTHPGPPSGEALPPPPRHQRPGRQRRAGDGGTAASAEPQQTLCCSRRARTLLRWQSGSSQETEGWEAEPAGDLGIAGRATPPQRARQAVRSKVGRGHACGASAVANWEEPYARAKASSRPLSSISGSCSASLTRCHQHPKCQTPRSTVKIDAEPISFDPEPRLV